MPSIVSELVHSDPAWKTPVPVHDLNKVDFSFGFPSHSHMPSALVYSEVTELVLV